MIPKTEIRKHNKRKSVSEGKAAIITVVTIVTRNFDNSSCYFMFISLPFSCPPRVNKVDDDAKLPSLKNMCTLGSNTGIKTELWSFEFRDYRCSRPISVVDDWRWFPDLEQCFPIS